MVPASISALQAAYEQALRTGTLAEVSATLTALFTALGDAAGAAWASQPAAHGPG